MHTLHKIEVAFKKLFFCFKITADIPSFIKLLWFTKKYKWSKKKPLSPPVTETVKYTIRLNNKRWLINLRTYCGDLDIFYEIFLKEVYKISGNSSSCTIVDAGANIGLASIYFLSKFPNATIISIEPDPENVEIFRKNLSHQIDAGSLKIIEAAIANEEAERFLSLSALKYNPKLISDSGDERAIKVNTVSMQAIFKQFSIADIELMKMDIEGGEEEIFSVDNEWVNCVKKCIIETHSSKGEEIILNAFYKKGFVHEKSIGSIHHFSK